MSDGALYDRIAGIYDPWSASVTEDIGLYVEQALASGGPVVELAVGTGRIAVPIAKAGVAVIGVDQSTGMLAVARAYAEREGVAEVVDLRVGDLREPPVTERVPLVTSPFRSMLHMADDDDRGRALGAAAAMLEPGGRLVFDVFAPSDEDIEETDGLWLEREPGIFERADWDPRERTLVSPFGGARRRRRWSSTGSPPRSGTPSSRTRASRSRRSTAGSTGGPSRAARTDLDLPSPGALEGLEHVADAHDPGSSTSAYTPRHASPSTEPRFSISSRRTSRSRTPCPGWPTGPRSGVSAPDEQRRLPHRTRLLPEASSPSASSPSSSSSIRNRRRRRQ